MNNTIIMKRTIEQLETDFVQYVELFNNTSDEFSNLISKDEANLSSFLIKFENIRNQFIELHHDIYILANEKLSIPDKNNLYASLENCRIYIDILTHTQINPINQRIYEIKANKSIDIGINLIKKGKQSTNFAIYTFIVSFLLSIVSVYLTYNGNISSGIILNENSKTIDKIVIKLDSVNEYLNLHKERKNIEYESVKVKLDSVLKRNK